TSCGYGTCSSTQKPQWYCSGGSCTYSCYNDSTCQPSCTNECSSGQKRCSSTTGYQTCGNYDSDSCYEWGTVSTCTGSTSCGYGTCSDSQKPQWYCTGAGTCTYTCYTSSTCQPSCTNECSYAGQTECYGNGVRTCGNYDSDSCLEWGSTSTCTGSTSCGYGTCSSTQKPQWYCSGGSCTYSCYNDSTCQPSCTNECSYAGQTECVNSHSYRTCGNYDSDSCLEWGTTTNCPSDTCIGTTLRQYYCNCGSGCGSGCSYTDTPNSSSCGYANPINVTCSGSPNPAQIGQTVSFAPSVSGGTGSYTYSWTGDCTGTSQNCYKSYSSAGIKTTTIYVTSGSQSGYANCFVTVEQSCPVCTNECSYAGQSECIGNAVRTCGNYDSDSCLEWGSTSTCTGSTSCGYGTCSSTQRPQWYCSGGSCTYSCYNDSTCQTNTLGCHDNDVWYLNYLGQPQNKYQDCGDNYCDNFGQAYCYNGDVYRSRNCYNKGCSGSSCYSYTNTEQQLYQDCTGNQTCSNGQCVSQCECTTGACCDGCHYKTNKTICNTQSEVEYSCPWGTGCGSDVGKRIRTKYQYCSGSSATCSGNWSDWGSWTTWLVADYCSSGEVCSSGKQTCTYKSSCNQILTKGCYNDNVYWFDQNGLRGALYKSCNDNNTCTLDGCSNGKCTNILKCDGTTCAKDSKDYCDNCEHCGDGICGCEENVCTCATDCKVTTISISLLGKISEATGDWQESISATPDATLEFLLIFANNGDSDLNNIVLTAAIPSEITPNGDLSIDGIPYGGDIRSGITLAQVPTRGIKTITFSGKVAKSGLIDLYKTDLGFTAQAVAGSISVTDYISISLSGAQGTSIGTASIAEILRGWLFWLALILVCIVLLAMGIFYLLFWLIRQRRQKITFQNQEVTLR
ncbi:MAG: hypothetical protein PHV47_02515, partial [Candidatus Pacebacteria bacterium]|nr:hypothetical protein [Candidatus Paceibacterota bacterium]